ncbi:MAG: filamentous hemagglutinin N-terminal domain-containing protein [Crocosphaera sp.]|nr:filamentous hemagglutinin N-terminal domain-containing protein [Crocosphaera sp.]
MMQPICLAQLTPDNTLGGENSKITNLDQLRQIIDGGAIRGNSLFHSFLEFNVAENGSVYFANPGNIQNILSRVTGGNASHILGTLGVLGNANLFLINPHGIIFGENAALDIKGSFYATTSNSIEWGEDGFFSATQPENSNLLSVNPDTLFFNHAANHQGTIINRGSLGVNVGENITFFANTVVNSGSLIAPAGTIKLLGDRIGLLNNSLIDVSHSNNAGNVFIGGDFLGEGSLPTATHTYVGSDAIIKANSTLNGDGGNVIVWGNESTYFYGKIEAQGGFFEGDGGFVEVSGKDFLDFRGTVNTKAVNGEIGTLLIDPTNIEVVEFFSPEAETFDLNDVDEFSDLDIGGDGDTKIDVFAINFSSSDVILQATNNITFNADVNALNSIDITAEAGNDIIVNNQIQIPNKGNINLIAGNNINLTNSNAYLWSHGKDILLDANNLVSINGDVLNFAGGGNLDTRPFSGSSGNINIKANSLILSDSATLLTAPSGGFLSGDINIESIGDINMNAFTEIEGRNINIKSNNNILMNGRIMLEENSEGTLNIKAGNDFLMTDGNAFIFTLGNDAFIDVANTLLISEAVTITNSSNIDTAPFNGDSGNLSINAKSVILSNGAQISTRPFNQGNGGILTIENADLVELRGQDTGLFTNSNFFNNSSGNMNISTQNLIIKDGSEINTSTEGIGNAGIITINSDAIKIEGNNSRIFSGVEFFAIGDGGDINITSNLLELNNGAELDSSSSSIINQDAGNITINANDLLINNGSNINAVNQTNGNSGTIMLNLDGKLHLQDNSLISTGIFNSNGQQGGDIKITANSVTLKKQSAISTRTSGQASAGNINISGISLSLSDDSGITTSTIGAGDSGTIKLDINGQISILNNSGILSSIGELATGNSQGIEINTESLILNDSILVTATESDGNAGVININARDKIIVDNDSAITSTAFEGNGNGGNININSSFVTLSNGSNIDSATLGKGRGATITIEADYLTVNNLSGILTTTLNQGDAGNIILNIDQQFHVDNSDITASSDIDTVNNIIPTGEAGSIFIK